MAGTSLTWHPEGTRLGSSVAKGSVVRSVATLNTLFLGGFDGFPALTKAVINLKWLLGARESGEQKAES